jgi:CheY-like chemotaxis protein
VDIWKEFHPDLIFMDISMPELDGCAASNEIRSIEGGRARVPIIALTAHAMEDDSVRFLAAGIDRHLTKPLRKSALASSFVAALELAKRGAVDLQQEATFAPLLLRVKA